MAFTTTQSSKINSFVYVPPSQAFTASRILVKPNMGYPQGPPATVSMEVMGKVLRGLRRANPQARILIVESTYGGHDMYHNFRDLGLLELLDDNIRIADANDLQMAEFPNKAPKPNVFQSIIAPAHLAEFECCISVGTFKQITVDTETFISASLKNLYGILPREHYGGGILHQPSVSTVLQDVYGAIGNFFHGAVVDLSSMLTSPNAEANIGDAVSVGQVVWGDGLLAVDEAACKLAGVPVPDYIHTIRQWQQEPPQ